jgi:hypothetical protein
MRAPSSSSTGPKGLDLHFEVPSPAPGPERREWFALVGEMLSRVGLMDGAATATLSITNDVLRIDVSSQDKPIEPRPERSTGGAFH